MSYAMELTKIFDQAGVRYKEDRYDEVKIVSVSYKLDIGEVVKVLYGFLDKKVEFYISNIAMVSEYKKEKMLNLLNEFNRDHGFVKFFIEEDGEVKGQADFLLVGKEKELAVLLFAFMNKLLSDLDDGLIKKIKKVQWD